MLISYGSTVPLLSVERTKVFRIVPDDNNQGPAIATVMRERGVRLLILFVRADVYGNGLANATRTAFEQGGGVVTEGMRFPVNTTNFTSALDVVRPQLTQATAECGLGSVGVLVGGYERDTVPVLIAAVADPQWSAAGWWGVDATPINAILADFTAAESAARLNYTGAQQAEGQGERYDRLTQNESVQRTVLTSDGAFAYDAVWIMARALAETGAGNSTALREAIPRIASSYNGITGNTALDAVGERAYANYDFWTIRSQNGTYVKVKTEQLRTDPRSGARVVLGSTTTAVVR